MQNIESNKQIISEIKAMINTTEFRIKNNDKPNKYIKHYKQEIIPTDVETYIDFINTMYKCIEHNMNQDILMSYHKKFNNINDVLYPTVKGTQLAYLLTKNRRLINAIIEEQLITYMSSQKDNLKLILDEDSKNLIEFYVKNKKDKNSVYKALMLDIKIMKECIQILENLFEISDVQEIFTKKEG